MVGGRWSKNVSLILTYPYPLFYIAIVVILCVLHFSPRVLRPLLTSLLCIVGDLAGGGSVAVAVGDSRR